MLGKMVALGFRMYTMPARLVYRGTVSMLHLPVDFDQFIAEIRAGSEQVAREVQSVIDSVDREMSEKAAHLSPEQRERAAELALSAAEQHLSMAAIDILRALWLATNNRRTLIRDADTAAIEHEN